MSQKTKDIIFYIVSAVVIVIAIICAIIEAVFNKQLPTWASVLLCSGIFILGLCGAFLLSESADKITKNRKDKGE